MTNDTPQRRNQPDDRDNWESLAEDLFGVDFQKSPPEPVEDDLLEELPLPPAAPEPAAESAVADDDTATDESEIVFGESDEDRVEQMEAGEDSVEPSAGAPSFEESAEAEPSAASIDEDIDDFWSGLDQFATEELITPDTSSVSEEEPADEQKIGLRPMRSGPVTDIPVTQSEFVEDAEFGVGVLDDVEVDDEEDVEAATAVEGAEESDEEEERPRRKRARRRRRRGRRKSSSEAETPEVESASVEKPSAQATADRPAPVAVEADELEDEDAEEEESASEPHTGYKNIPTWSQAIAYLTKRGGSTAATEAGPAESSGGKRSRTRGRRRGAGRRRRRRPDSSSKSDPG